MGASRIDQETRERAYEAMARMRAFEETQATLWERGLVPGELHTGIGEEAIVAGVVLHLQPDDAMALDHRSTPPLIARGADPRTVLLEVLGSDDGCNGGHGGHMHLFMPELSAASDGIVGSAGPLACGFGLAAQHRGAGGVAVAFFGEGAANQGMMLESWNLAVHWQLPVLFVCKDNDWSITTRSRQVTGGQLVKRARAFGLTSTEVDGTRVEQVHDAVGRLLARVRAGRGPALIHAHCHRPGGHFMGDPLLRLMQEPAAQVRELGGPLAAAVTASPGAPTRARLRALGTLAGRVGALGWQYSTRRRDPLTRARRLVGEPAAERIESRVHAAMGEMLHDVLDTRDAQAPVAGGTR